MKIKYIKENYFDDDDKELSAEDTVVNDSKTVFLKALQEEAREILYCCGIPSLPPGKHNARDLNEESPNGIFAGRINRILPIEEDSLIYDLSSKDCVKITIPFTVMADDREGPILITNYKELAAIEKSLYDIYRIPIKLYFNIKLTGPSSSPYEGLPYVLFSWLSFITKSDTVSYKITDDFLEILTRMNVVIPNQGWKESPIHKIGFKMTAESKNGIDFSAITRTDIKAEEILITGDGLIPTSGNYDYDKQEFRYGSVSSFNFNGIENICNKNGKLIIEYPKLLNKSDYYRIIELLPYILKDSLTTLENINVIYSIKIDTDLDKGHFSTDFLIRAFNGGHTQDLKYKLLKSSDTLNIYMSIDNRVLDYDDDRRLRSTVLTRLYDIKNGKRLE